jgi:hypothetical protein
MLLLASNQLYNKPWSSTYYADAMHATQGWQSHLYIALELKSLSFKPICYIFGSPSARSCESRESALMCVLIYLNNSVITQSEIFTMWTISCNIITNHA